MPPKKGRGGGNSPREKKDKKSPKGKKSKSEREASVTDSSISEVPEDVESESSETDSENDSVEGSLENLDLNDVNDAGQIVSLLKSVVKELVSLKEKDLKDVKNNQSTMLSDLNDIKTENEKLRQTLQKQAKEIETLKGKHGTLVGEVNSVKDTLKSHGDSLKEHSEASHKLDITVKSHDDTLKEHNDRLHKLDTTVNELVLDNMVNDGTAGKEFPYSRTIVAYNVPYEEDENIEWKAKSLIHNILALPGIEVVRAKRKGLTEESLGIVKIELHSTHAVTVVLENKRLLMENEDSVISGIFIRQSQPEEVRRAIRNTNIMLREFDVDGKFRTNVKGDIVPRSRGNYRGQRGRGNRGRGGRGRGGPGRRGHGGRGRGSRGHGHIPDYDKWSQRPTNVTNENSDNNSGNVNDGGRQGATPGVDTPRVTVGDQGGAMRGGRGGVVRGGRGGAMRGGHGVQGDEHNTNTPTNNGGS